ncbi:MAG: phosphatidate cytidylyltransferase [Candidatus Baltobacteraceae bacterium]
MSAAAGTPAVPAHPITSRRIVVGVALAIVGLSCVFYEPAFYLLLLVLGMTMLFELSRLCDIKGQPLEIHVAVAGVAGYLALAVSGLMAKWEGALLASIILAAFWLGMYGDRDRYFSRTAHTLLAVLYLGKLITYFVFIRELPGIGCAMTIYVIVLIALTDVFAMLIGSAAGRHQLTKVSPKKTVEGSLGAIAIVTVLGALAAALPLLHVSWAQGAILGAVTCAAAQAGDLVESALKRDAGVKDTGTVIQGHGGVLDRFDSYLFGGMAFFATLHVIGAVPLG